MPGRRGGGLAVVVLLLVMAASDAKELRPAVHGLASQSSPPAGLESSPEMLTFFGKPPSAASAPRPPAVALPQAMDSGDAALWSQQQQQQEGEKPALSSSPSSKSRSSGRVVKEGLLIGSLVCGITGAALLAASAFIFLFFTSRKPKSPPPPPSSASDAHLRPQHHDHNSAIA